jgi:hypothetical protein
VGAAGAAPPDHLDEAAERDRQGDAHTEADRDS